VKKSAKSAGKRVDERVQRSKEAVLAATYELLSEVGLSGASVDEVAKRSGVAKTTIYRHWPSRAKLILDACAKLSAKPPVPETGTLKGDLLALAAGIANRLQTANFSTILPSVIDAAERDPEIAKLHSQLHGGFMAPIYTVIERAHQTGELSSKHKAPHLVARLVGPLMYRRWFSREPLDEEFVKVVVEGIVSAALPKA
jgi:AcrR family transcriptional regulator